MELNEMDEVMNEMKWIDEMNEMNWWNESMNEKKEINE